MATLTIQEFNETGNDLTLSAASSGGDQFKNTGTEFLVIKNDNTTNTTVTIIAQDTAFDSQIYGKSVKQNQNVTVSASGGVMIIGPFPVRAFNDANKNLQITYSDATSVEIAAVKIS